MNECGSQQWVTKLGVSLFKMIRVVWSLATQVEYEKQAEQHAIDRAKRAKKAEEDRIKREKEKEQEKEWAAEKAEEKKKKDAEKKAATEKAKEVPCACVCFARVWRQSMASSPGSRDIPNSLVGSF